MQSETDVQEQVQNRGGVQEPEIKTPKASSPLLTEARMEKSGFAPDQVDILISKLGVGKLTALMDEYESTGDVEAKAPLGVIRRGKARMIPWQSRFYQRCLREMGEFRPGRGGSRLPNATQAWREVINQRLIVGKEPEFTHPMIVQVIESFGGWDALWKEFDNLEGGRARLRWVKAYNEMAG